ncbi:MAG: glycosyltransferase family 2 protein, partial [Acidobacteria bacterium]|nr:glycosyltransferase family 2 protein [Acidobacteriota bacterium]
MSLVSVIMPMRNEERYVRAAAESVLAQEGVELELIVVDDHSTDGSVSLLRAIRDRRIRIVSSPGRGVAAACNAGCATARGELLALCGADDLFAQNRLGWQAGWLADHPEFGAVCGKNASMTRQGRVVCQGLAGDAPEEVTEELSRGITRTSIATFLLRTEQVRAAGGCRGFFVTSSDVDLMLRIGEVCRVWYDPRVCYYYRLHDASITHSQSGTLREFYASTARKFCAQRQATGLDDLQRGCPPDPPSEGLEPPMRAADEIQGTLTGLAWRQHKAGL